MNRVLPFLVLTFLAGAPLLAQRPPHTAGTANNSSESSTTIMSQTLAAPRTKINFNRNWKFMPGDNWQAKEEGYDDSGWQDIGLPHSFSMPYFMSPDFYVGYGWYRKTFNLPAGFTTKNYFLEFEGVFQEAEIFVNNKKAGAHKGGYTGFSINITGLLQQGANLISVRVNNIWQASLAPRAGEHVFSGGIYRDVFLTVVNPVHVDWYGTFIKTPVVNSKQAAVNVATTLNNEGNEKKLVQVKTDIINPQGKRLSSTSAYKEIPAGSAVTINQQLPVINSPELWDTGHAVLYTAITTLLIKDKISDTYTTNFGIRSIRWTADSGFYLNGKHLYLLGANVHQDHAGWGDAVTNEGFNRDVKMMKDAGFNFIRGSHYPHDPAFVQSCDKNGMLFWSENVFWGIGGGSDTPEGNWISSAYPSIEKDRAGFEASLRQQLTEMIRIHRNSPSVIAWSMSNEPFFTVKETMPYVRDLLKELAALAKQLDDTRPAAVGGAQRPLDASRIDKQADIAGYNGDGGVQPPFQNPGIPNLVSEYGSTTAERPGNYEPGWGDIAKDSGRQVYAWRSGQAIWCGYDHGSVAGTRLGKMGIVDYFRIPKRAWYWYRNHYKKIPPPQWPTPGIPAKLKLEADKNFANTDGTDDVKLLVTVLDATGKPVSNNPPVELTVIDGPGEFPTGNSIQFEENSDIRILDGQAAIELRSWYAGKAIIRASSPGLLPAAISINFKGNTPYIKGKNTKLTRTYTRFTKEKEQNSILHFGQNNPAYSSSFMPGHASGFAVDGNAATWWQALPADTAPEWKLDTEKKLLLHTIVLVFPEVAKYQFAIDVSEDGSHWITLEDQMNNQSPLQNVTLDAAGKTGGIIRIRFKDAAMAKMAEVNITGTITQ